MPVNGVTAFERHVADYENHSGKFLLPKKEFIKQFYGVYTSRLAKISGTVTKLAIEKWGPDVPVKKLADLREEDSDKCILVGTLYKQQKLKPSILREITDENHVIPQPTTVYFDESDKLILEDGLNRIALTGKIETSKMVTGVVCALLGEYGKKRGERSQRELQLLILINLLLFLCYIDNVPEFWPSIDWSDP